MEEEKIEGVGGGKRGGRKERGREDIELLMEYNTMGKVNEYKGKTWKKKKNGKKNGIDYFRSKKDEMRQRIKDSK